ncbi:gliding motility-associated C-terminal domain-containing protein [Chitinophaga sp. YR573]|uniref:Ig-like domain-containing protein n=1 Tax=Chitinophaga sp. YR573 TaxID=1881040 RepID=UPI0008B590EB|nr:gliding motility-associated C-terminal domain-containing protein [Chitinophaga sp. YR573]SEW09622.1 gliding motility-associated C-terminal domain-containing protein [Chitinophaga sp. YR573]
MHFNATPKSPLRAFIFTIISLIWLVGLPVRVTYAKKLPASLLVAQNNNSEVITWLNEYLKVHPNAPIQRNDWMAADRHITAAGPLWSYAGSQSVVTFGVACALCAVENPANAIDGNVNTAATLVLPVGAVGGVGLKLKFPGSYLAGDRIALDLEIPDQVLSGQLLSAISVTTFNAGVANNDAITLDNGIARFDLLGFGAGSTPKFRVTIPVTKNFDEVQVNLSAIVAGFGSLLVYEATAFIPVTVSPAAPSVTSGGTVTFSSAISRIPDATFRWYTTATGGAPVSSTGSFTTPALKRSTTYYVEATSPTDGLTSTVRTPVTVQVSGGVGPLWIYADQQQSPITGGIACLLCYVDNPGNAVDADTTTASTLRLPVGALTSIGQLLEFPGGYKAGDNIVLDLEIPGQTLSVSALGGIQVQTFKGATANNDAITLSAANVQVDLLGFSNGTTRKFRVTIPVTKDFDRAQVSLTSAFAAFGALNIYEAAASIPVKVTPANPATTAGGSVSLTASIDARVASPVFKWYTDAQGGTPIVTSGTFATPPLNRTTTYYVEAYAAGDNLSSYTRTPVTVKVAGGPGTIWSFGQDQESPITSGLACLGCLVSNPLLAADGDTTTAATLTVPLGVAGTVGQLVKLPGVYQAGDSIVLFLDSPSQDLAAVLLPKVKVTTYNNSIAGPAVSNNDAVTLSSAPVNIKFLGAGLNNAGKYRVTIPATKTFDGVQVDFGGLVGVAGTLNLYEVAAMIPVKVLPDPAKTAYSTSITLTPSIRITNPTFHWYTTPTGGTPVFSGSGAFTTPALIRNTNYYVEAEDPAGTVSLLRTVVPVTIGGGNGPLWTYGTAQQSPITGGLACALCVVKNPQFAVDGDTSSASLLSLPLGVATTLGQKINFPGVYHSGDSIIFILGTKGNPILDASLLGAIKVTTSLNNVSNNDAQLLNNPLLTFQLLSLDSISKFRIAVPVTKTFDAAQIDLSSLLAANNSLYVFEAAAMIPVMVTPSSASITAGQTASFAATLPSIPGAVFNWYETKTGGAPVHTGSNFTTPPLYQDKTYYVEALSPTDGLISFERTGVSVSVNNLSGNGALSCSGVKTQNNGVTGICLLCGVTNAANAIDDLPLTASSLNSTVGLASTVYQDLIFAKAGKAGDTIRLGLGTTTGLLELTLLGGISVGLGNGARPADADMTALNPQFLGIRLLSGVQQSAYAFVATKAFDRVEIRVNALLTALNTLNVYYAQIVTPIAQVSAGTVFACSGTSATLSAVGPNGYNYRWYSSYTGGTPVGYGATFTTPVVTKDTIYFVETRGTDSCGSETRTPVQVKVGLPSVNVTPSSASVAQSATPTFNVVSPNAAYKYNWYTVPTGGTPVFVGSQFTTPPVTANITYYVEAVNASNASCKSLRTPVSITLNGDGGPTTPVSDIDCGGATSQQTTTSGICIGCYVAKQDSAVDNSTQTASVMYTVLGVGSYVQQSLIFSATGVKGDSVRIKLGFQVGLIDLSVLSGIQVSSSNAGTANNDGVTLAPELANVKLINGNRDLFFTFAPSASFDRVNIRLNGLATALTALKVYSAQIFAGTPTVEKDTVYMCLGGSAAMKATGPGTSFRWYNQPTGGSVLATGATYTVSPTTNAIYYVEALSSSGCINPVRKAVYVIVGLPQPLVSPAVQTINSGQTATFTVTNPNPAYQYNWYNLPAGGTVLKANSTTYTTPALTAAAVYYVEVKDPANNCTSATRTMVRVDINLPTEPTPCSYATLQQSPIIAGICLLCGVSDGGLAVDQNANSASTITSTVGALGYVGQLLQYAHTYPAGDSVTLDLEVPGQLVNATLLGGIRIETYNNSTANGDVRFLNNGLIRLSLLNAGNRFRVTIPTTKTFNGVLVSINGVLTALSSVKVYFAAVTIPRATVAVTNVNTCSGNTATLTATSPNAADIAWYTDAVGGTAVGTGGQFITPVLTSSVTYYVEASRFGCANPTRVPVTVNVGTTPVAPTAASRSICTGSQITLLATAPAGVTFRWYTAATGGTLLASTAAYTTNALTADTAFYVESDNNGCKSVTRTRVKVTVSAAPTGLTVTPLGTSVSSGQGALFTASATGTNLRYVWYNAAGDSIFNAAVFNTGPLITTTTYSVEAVNASGCRSSARVFVTATVIPGGNDIPCDAATSETNTANGICLGCFVENPALAVDNSTSTSSTLRVVLGLLGGYVQQTLIFPQVSELNDSTQIRLSFDAALVGVQLLSTIQIGSYNGATSNNDFVALNSPEIKVILLSGNQQAMVGFKPKGVFDRIVVRLNSGLAAAISSVNINYASRLVGLPVVKGDTVCSGGRATLTASGPSNVTFRWYTTATGGTSIFTGNSYQTPALIANTTFYVEALKTSLTCPNPTRVPVIAVVDPAPDAPALDTTALTICSGSTATFNVKADTGAVYRWYTTLTGGTAIFTGASFTTPSLTATTVYYVEASNNSGCSNTTRTKVTANVITQPPVPVITPAGTSICAGNSTQLVATSATSGLTFRWYTVATGGTAVFTGATFNTPVLNTTTTYYVETVTGTCTSSSRAQVTVTVNEVPAAPTVTTVPVNGQVVSGQSATLTASSVTPGVTYNWYTTATGGSPVFTGAVFQTPALTSSITYYAEAVSPTGGCPSTRTAVALTVTIVPNTDCDFANAQASSTTAICLLCTIENPTNTIDANTDNFSTLTIPLSAGNGSVQQMLIFPQVTTAGDSVRIVMELPAQVLEASLLGAIEVSSFNGATANNDAILLNNTGALSLKILSGGSKFTVAFVPGAAYDRVQVRLRGGIISALVKLNIYYASRQVSPPVVAVRNVSICSGTSAVLNATASSVANLEWYDAPVGGTKVADGATFTTPILTATKTYYVQSVRGSNNCANANRVSVTVSVVPSLVVPTVNNATICSGNQATLTATVAAQNIQIRWYSAPTGGTLLFTGPTYITNALTADTAFYVETSNGTCSLGTRVRATVTVGSGAPTPTLESNNVNICEGTAATFRVTSNTTGITYKWYTTLTGGTAVFTGPVFVTPLLSATTVYYVESSNTASQCNAATARVQVTANVSLNPVAPVVVSNSVQVCMGQNAVLSVQSPQAGLTYQWYTALTGGTLAASGATITVQNVTGNVDYYVQAVNSNGCANAGSRVKVSVIAVASPGTPAVTAVSVNVCQGNTAVLSVQNPDATLTYRWYSTATGGTSLGSGSSFTTPVINADTDFYVEASNGNCSSAVRARVSVLVTTPAPVPTLESNNVGICTGGNAVFRITSATAGITYNWYTVATGGVPVFSGPEFTTPSLTTTTVYYVEAVNTLSQCGSTSARVQVTASVSPNPVAPVVVSNSVQVCMGQNAVLSVQSPQAGLTYQWYTALTGGTLAGSGATFTVQNVTADVDYYVQAVNSNGCANAGGRVKVSVIAAVSPGTPAVTAASVNVCQGNTAVLSVQNPDATLTYRWYSTATGGTSLGSGSSFTTPVINADTDFYVEASNGNCSSAVRAKVSVLIATAAPVPTLESNNVSTCTGGSAVLKVTSSTTDIIYNWYTTATGGTPVFTGPEFTTPLLTTTTIYYVEAVNTLSQCGSTSARASATVTVGQSPDVPTLVANSVRVCAGKDVTLAIQNPQAGITYQWFDAATGGTLVFSGTTFNVTAVTADVTYYVQAASGTTCVSASRATASILVDAAAPTPEVVSTNQVTCVGGTATLNVLNPDASLTYRWYDAPAGGNLLSTGAEYTTGPLSVNTTFYVEALNSTGCSSQARKGVTVTIVNSIDAPLAPGTTVCSGNSAVLSVTSPQAGISYKWYTTATGGTAVFTGANFTTAALTADVTYYVEAATGGCVSQSRTIVQVMVNSTPAAPVVANASVIACLGGSANLSVQNPDATLTYRWYDSPTGGTLVATGASFTTGALSTNQMYYVEALNTTGCSSITRTAVSVTIGSPSNDATVTGNEAGVCPGESATLTATSTTAGANFRWYTDAIGGTAIFTGSTFTTPALTASTTYYVEVFATGGCTSTNRIAVQVNVLEVLATPVVTVDSTTVNSVTFSWAPVTGATAYEVTLDDGVTYSAPSSGSNGTSHTIAGLSPDQSVTIRVRALGGSTCETSALSVAVTGKAKNPQGNKIFVPNVFTPNGDGVNDIHYIYGNTIAEVVIRYYNQFGQLIYESKDQRKGWDGKVSGTLQPVGVYIYVLRAKLQDGSIVNMKGTITIVR